MTENAMDNSGDHQIVPGISVSSSGQATVDPSLDDGKEAPTLPAG